MNKEKIVLKDGTEIEIENGASSNVITILAADFTVIADLYEKKMTEANLEEYRLTNAVGQAYDTRTNQYVASANVSTADVGYKVAFNIANVDMVAKRLDALEETQEIQDGAIIELAGMAVGGE